jgi:drug/metabolite transporter (DMT)-like permease
MHRARAILAIILIAAGLVWIGQGSGVLPGSVMSGDPKWAWIGAALVVLGIALAALEVRSRRVQPH